MHVDYVYCSFCGYEDDGIFVAYGRTVANGDVLICPGCKSETMNFEAEEV